MFDFLKAKNDLQKLAGEAKALRAQIEEKKQQRDALEVLPLPRDDLATTLCDWVDQEARAFPEHLAAGIQFLIRKPNLELPGRGFALLHTGSGGRSDSAHVPPANLCYLLGDMIKENLRKAVDEIEYPEEVGPPRSERPALMKKLDSEIQKLEKQLGDLVANADAIGITI
jgi:hypothetical protein